MRAALPPRQRERLAALKDLAILDSEPEPNFDEVVRLAAEICGAPISAMGLIDSENHYLKAGVGLVLNKLPIDHSICAHTILEDDILVIDDTLKDARTADNPYCTGEAHLRFYAGAALRDAEGLPFGALCVLDHSPRTLSEFQRSALRTLARQISAQIELRQALRREDSLRQEMRRRTGNALQLLSALVQVQRDSTQSEEAWLALDLLQSRVATVERLVDGLDGAEPGAAVDLGRYVGTIADLLQPGVPPDVALEVLKPGEPVRVTAEQAAAVGVMLNELAGNAFRHAFPAGRPGVVLLSLRALPDGRVEVECVDDGVGLPDDLAALDTGQGLKIVEAVAMGLGADIDYKRAGRGLSVRATFASRAAAEAGDGWTTDAPGAPGVPGTEAAA
jgi:two-component sensor histidine kinase